jgi:hypothetical protein
LAKRPIATQGKEMLKIKAKKENVDRANSTDSVRSPVITREAIGTSPSGRGKKCQ